MEKNTLIIVESGKKINQLKSILGKGYNVVATGGHIMDLDPSTMSIDIENKFEPKYCIIKTKHEQVRMLKKEYSDSTDVLIATDLDREGEMIASCVADVLKIKNAKRIIFNSITKKPILDAIKKPQPINKEYVNSQKMRRILDRLVGYLLSPLLWKNIGNPKLSAGRVQSAVLKLIIEKENEINKFFEQESVSYFKINKKFNLDNSEELNAILHSTSKKNDNDKHRDDDNEDDEKNMTTGSMAKINTSEDVKKLLKLMMKSSYKINSIEEKEKTRSASAPFETATLQQEASNKFGFTPKRTMASAEHLYQEGYITYLRTDSINLSPEAMESIEKLVKKTYGKKYYKKMEYKTKSSTAQEAHEAIRPTDFTKINIVEKGKNIGSDEVKLYSLIWKRTVASQMENAKFNVTNIKIKISKTDEYYFASQFENMTFAGFLSVYNMKNIEENNDETNMNSKLKIKKGEKIEVKNIKGIQEFKTPPKRYNEASIVTKLKKLEIGRPATYASLIEKIKIRNYADKGNADGIEQNIVILEWNKDEKKINELSKKISIGKEINKIIPTSIGILVNEFIVGNFPEITDYKFTTDMEKNLDKIANGELDWKKVLKDFYDPFNKLVNKIADTIKPKSLIDKNARILGNHPEHGYEIIATLAKHGAVVKMMVTDKKIEYAPIKKPLTIKNITLTDAVKLFEWPKILGKYEKNKITLCKGKYGYWLTVGSKNKISLGDSNTYVLPNETKTKSIEEMNIEDASILIKNREKEILWKDADNKYKYIVKDGPYGKYVDATEISEGKKSKSIRTTLPTDQKMEDMTLKIAQDLIINKKQYNKSNKKIKKK